MKTVLVYVTRENQQVTSRWLRGFSRYAKVSGWNVETFDRIDRRQERARLRRAIGYFRPCGIVSAYFEGLSNAVPDDMPVVWMDSAEKDIPLDDPLVSHDDGEVADSVVREFDRLKLNHFAAVGERPNHVWSRMRIEAFASVVKQRGGTFDVVYPTCEPADKVGCQKVIGAWLKKLPRPCGVFAVCDRVAANVLSAANRLKIAIPRELSVVSVDNDEDICLLTNPPLSSIATDWEKAGYLAGKILDEKIRNPHAQRLRAAFGELGIVRRASSSFGGNRVDVRVSDASLFIREHACEGIGVEDVVARMGCSRRLAEQRFLETTGRSIFAEIREVQFARVMILLAKRDIQLGAIADQCGWKSPMALRTYFASRMGMTMREWRQKNAAS